VGGGGEILKEKTWAWDNNSTKQKPRKVSRGNNAKIRPRKIALPAHNRAIKEREEEGGIQGGERVSHEDKTSFCEKKGKRPVKALENRQNHRERGKKKSLRKMECAVNHKSLGTRQHYVKSKP